MPRSYGEAITMPGYTACRTSVVVEPDGCRAEQPKDVVDRTLRIVGPGVQIPSVGQVAEVRSDATGSSERRAVGSGSAGADADGFANGGPEAQGVTTPLDTLNPPTIDEKSADLVVHGAGRRPGAVQRCDGADRVFQLVLIGHKVHASQESEAPRLSLGRSAAVLRS